MMIILFSVKFEIITKNEMLLLNKIENISNINKHMLCE